MLRPINCKSDANDVASREDKEAQDSSAGSKRVALPETPTPKPGALSIPKFKRPSPLALDEHLDVNRSVVSPEKKKLPRLAMTRSNSAPSGDLVVAMRRSSALEDRGFLRRMSTSSNSSVQSPANEVGRIVRRSPAAVSGQSTLQPLRRRVTIVGSPTFHDVTPYGQKYGQHPSFFNFTRTGEMALTDAGIADELRKGKEI